MADETNDIKTGAESSTPTPGVSAVPTPTPAPAQAGAGVSVPEEIPDVGLLRPTPPIASPTVSPPVSDIPRPYQPAKGEDAMQADIQKILGSVKLPERHGTTPEPKKQIIVAPIEQHLEKPAQSTTESERPIVVPVHTLRDDIQHVVRDSKMSLVRAATLEEDRRLKEDQSAPENPGQAQRSSRTKGVLFAAALFIALGLAAIGGVVLVMQQQAASPVQSQTPSLIFAEQNLLLPIDSASAGGLKQQVAQLRVGQPGSLGSITRIIPTVSTTTDGSSTTRPATTQEFFEALALSAPEELTRALGEDLFFGMHSADKNAPVFVIPVLSYEHAFAGMLAWERSLNGDLAPIFTPLSLYKTGADGIPRERLFQDAVIRNYDTRTLSDDNETIELYYSFPSPNILVIAESPYTFAEVLNRLRAQRRL